MRECRRRLCVSGFKHVSSHFVKHVHSCSFICRHVHSGQVLSQFFHAVWMHFIHVVGRCSWSIAVYPLYGCSGNITGFLVNSASECLNQPRMALIRLQSMPLSFRWIHSLNPLVEVVGVSQSCSWLELSIALHVAVRHHPLTSSPIGGQFTSWLPYSSSIPLVILFPIAVKILVATFLVPMSA